MASRREEFRLVHRIADALVPAMRRRLLRIWEKARGRVPVRALEAALTERRANAQSLVDTRLADDLRGELRRMIEEATSRIAPRAFRLAREETRKQDIDPALAFTFDATSPSMLAYAAEKTGTLVREIVADQLATIRALIADGFREGIAPRETARTLRDSIGLTQRDANAAFRYQLATEKTLLEAGVGPAQASIRARELGDKYRARLLRKRAETIARHETLSAASQGEHETWRQMRDAGLLGADFVRIWIVATDERTCQICRPLEGLTAPLGIPFSGPTGVFQAPPAHVQCRCSTGLVPASDVPPARDVPAFNPPVRTLRPRIPQRMFAA